MPEPIDASKYLPQILEDIKDHTLSIKDIADKAGVSYSWVYTTLRKLNIPHGRVQGRQVTPEREQTIVNMSLEGKTIKEIAEATGYTGVTICVYRRKHGLSRPKSGWLTRKERIEIGRQKAARRYLKETIEVLELPCGPQAHHVALRAAQYLNVPVKDIVDEAIEHYINHLKS